MWGPRYWDDEHLNYASRLLDAADALLLGRKTYEGFAGRGRARPRPLHRPDQRPAEARRVAHAHQASWNATVIPGDVVERVAELKRRTRDDRQSAPAKWTPAHRGGLLDELHLWVFPVIAGAGDRLLPGIDPTHFRLLDTSVFSSGIVVHALAPKG